MITDTCKCGAEFKVEYGDDDLGKSCELGRHRDWLDAHKGCREAVIPFSNPTKGEEYVKNCDTCRLELCPLDELCTECLRDGSFPHWEQQA